MGVKVYTFTYVNLPSDSKSSLGAVALTTGFANGAGQIWLDQVNCRGTETRLIGCPANPLGQHDCSHLEDAGVRCQPGRSENTDTLCTWITI